MGSLAIDIVSIFAPYYFPGMELLKFATFTSDIELPFYASLASHKINHDKLDDSARRLLGLYEVRPSNAPEASCRMQVHGNALTNDAFVPTCSCVVHLAKVLQCPVWLLSRGGYD